MTFAPLYLFAHKLGATLLGTPDTPPPDLENPEPVVIDAQASGWAAAWQGLLALGKPLLLGLSILAVVAGLLTYALVMLFWRLKTAWQWRRRRGGRA